MKLIIEASSDEGDLVWEPFGGLCSATVAAMELGRRAVAAERDRDVYEVAIKRFQ